MCGPCLIILPYLDSHGIFTTHHHSLKLVPIGQS